MLRDGQGHKGGWNDGVAESDVHGAVSGPRGRLAGESAGADVWEPVCGADECDVQCGCGGHDAGAYGGEL